MGTFSNAEAVYGLIATGTHKKTGVAEDVRVGTNSTRLALTSATKAYVVSARLITGGSVLTIDPTTGIATGDTAPVAQVETATAAGTITGSGNATVVVTGARITGSPVTVSVAVLNTDTASTWAGKVRTALSATAAITAVYTVGGSGTSITLTETDPLNNDSTLNISLANGTCTGITTAATSANTTAGVGGVKLLANTGDGNDFEGVSLGTFASPTFRGMMVKVTEGACDVEYGNAGYVEMLLDSVFIHVSNTDPGSLQTVTITDTNEPTTVEVTLIR